MLPCSDASRPLSQPRSGILTPASDGSVNQQSPRSAGSRRKSAGDESAGVLEGIKQPCQARPAMPMEELLKPSIVVKPHPPNVLAKSVTLQPLMLLPRECLPLAHIDLSAPHGELHPARFFESHIRIMELEGRLGSNVLIARSESSRIVYAIERHANGHYVVCKLGSWVDVAHLAQDSTVICAQRLWPPKPSAASPGCLGPPLITPQIYKESKRKRQAIEDLQLLCRKRQRSQSVAGLATQQQQQQQPPHCHLPTPVEDVPNPDRPIAKPSAEHQAEESRFQEDVATQPASFQPVPGTAADIQRTADDIFTHIRTQYIEALYHSMGSLAYFAKGPLSRARAAFNLNCDGNLEMTDLIDFLKSLVLTTILIDKKYLTTIPNVIERMKLAVESSDEGAAHRPKKKSSKKMRISKEGMYPAEEENVKRWWNTTRPELRDDETSVNPQQVRYHISCLRRRETLLQLILILEILSLEASRRLENPADVQLPGLEAGSKTATKPANTDTVKKKRSKHNYPVLLDVHADRLCIWESTTLDDVKALAESQSRTGEVRKSDKPLVDFCVDVILPFFSARLPEVCDSLNRKLGGPVLQSPPKQRREKGEGSSKSRAKPGAPMKRPAAKSGSSSQSARSLERVLSNDKLRRSVSRGPSDALAHLRHATVAHVPGLKREASETRSLKDIPQAEANSSMDRPPSLLHSRSSSFNGAEDARAKKKAMVEAELQDAISALKKPNRVLAGKVLAEETERRLFAGPTYVTKSKRPARSPINKVQVKATPANYRFKDALAEDPRNGQGFNLSRAHQAVDSGLAAERTAKSLLSLGDSPCVAKTPLVPKSQQPPAAGPKESGNSAPPEHRDEFVLTSSPIQARKTAARMQPPARWLQPVRSRGLLFPPGQVGLVPASSPQQPRDGSDGDHDDDDPLSTGDRRATAAPRARSLLGSLAETPVKQRSRPVDGPTPAGAAFGTVMSSPSAKKTMAITIAAEQLPSISVSPPKVKARTIYQQLGWDDDYPDELS